MGDADDGDVSLRGLTQLMNPQHLRPDVNLAAAEDNSAARPALEFDASVLLGPDVIDLAAELGIDLTDYVAEEPPPPEPAPAEPAPDEYAPYAPYDAESADSETASASSRASSASSRARSRQSARSRRSSRSRRSQRSRRSRRSARGSPAPGARVRPPAVGGDPHLRVRDGPTTRLIPGGELEARTHEQESRAHIDAVLNQLDGGREFTEEFALDREQEDEMKAQKLESIDNLQLTLSTEEGVVLDFELPTMASPMADIDHALRRLQLKIDRLRYSSLAEEFLLGGAEVLESIFDGTRPLPLIGVAPDYRGYSGTVGVKLRRMRHETSTLVGDTMRRWGVGPGTRILIELLPSLLLYPRQNGATSQARATYTHEQVSRATGAIRDQAHLQNI